MIYKGVKSIETRSGLPKTRIIMLMIFGIFCLLSTSINNPCVAGRISIFPYDDKDQSSVFYKPEEERLILPNIRQDYSLPSTQVDDAGRYIDHQTLDKQKLLNLINDYYHKSGIEMLGTEQLTMGEYIDQPLALVGHHYVQGGAGEGKQLLGPDGTFENFQVVKSDNAVPSYCDPPNPCPIGYTSKDGCLEEFVNSAGFSRDYQAKQQCSCDNEHSLFNCASPISTLANTVSTNGYEQPDNNDNDIDDTNDKIVVGEIKQKLLDNPLLDNSRDDSSNNDNNEIQQQPNSYGQYDDSEDPMLSSNLIPVNKLQTLARTITNRFGGLQGLTNYIFQGQQSQSLY